MYKPIPHFGVFFIYFSTRLAKQSSVPIIYSSKDSKFLQTEKKYECQDILNITADVLNTQKYCKAKRLSNKYWDWYDLL